MTEVKVSAKRELVQLLDAKERQSWRTRAGVQLEAVTKAGVALQALKLCPWSQRVRVQLRKRLEAKVRWTKTGVQ